MTYAHHILTILSAAWPYLQTPAWLATLILAYYHGKRVRSREDARHEVGCRAAYHNLFRSTPANARLN